MHITASNKPIFSNWNKFNRNGILRMRIINNIAPPTTHFTVLLGVRIILKKLEVHERFDIMMAIFEEINVTKVSVLTAFSE